MINDISGYSIPITLKQMEPSMAPVKNDQINTSEKILDSFGEILKKQITDTNTLQKVSANAKESFAVGGNVSLHEVMIKAEKAGMAMDLTMQLRNKLLAAYKEIQNMNV